MDRAVKDISGWAGGSSDWYTAAGTNYEHDWRVPRARVSKLWTTNPAAEPQGRLDVRIEDLVREETKPPVLHFHRPENECNRATIVNRDTLLFHAMRLRAGKEIRIDALKACGHPLTDGASDADIDKAIMAVFPLGQPSNVEPKGRQLKFLDSLFGPAV